MSTPTPARTTAKTKRRQHTKEFKQEAVRLARQEGIGFVRASKDLGIHESLLRSWSKAQAREGADAFRGHGKKAALEAENARLARENRTLQMERDILKKAMAFFAKESP
jgi:transposase